MTLLSLAVTPTDPSIASGTMQPLVATGTYSNSTTRDVTAEVTWESSDDAVATVSNTAGDNGIATAVDVGNAIISATMAGITGSTMITVTSAVVTSVSVSPTQPSIADGTTQPFTATGIFSDGSSQDLTTQATWASSDETIATISNDAGSNGLATGVAVGSTTVSATFSGISGSTSLEVTSAILVSIDVMPTDPSIADGTTQPLTATGIFSDSTTQDLTDQATWTSSDETVATVSNTAGSNGVATGVALGSTTVSATFSGISGSTTLTVTAAVLVSILVTPTEPTMADGTSQAVTATGTFSDASTQDLTDQATWTSSDEAVATVSNVPGSKGTVTGVDPGMVTVSASLSGISGSTSLEVTGATLVSLAVTPPGRSIADGTTQLFAATGTYTDNSTQDLTNQATWTSSDETVATISNAAGSNGLATGVGTGSATIMATLSGISGSVVLTVTDAVLASLEVTPPGPFIANGTTQHFTATGIFSDGSTQDLTIDVTWASSDESVATISNAAGSHGLATGVDVGATTVSATLSGISSSTMLTITDAVLVSLEVSPFTPSLANGRLLQFVAIGEYSDDSTQDHTADVTWASSDESIATISNAAGSRGLATAVGLGTTTVSATLSGISGSTMLTVTDAELDSLAVTPVDPVIPGGMDEQFTATGTFSDASTQDLTTQVTWASSDSAVAPISNATGSKGLATCLSVGSATISASLLGITGSTTITVSGVTVVSILVTPNNPALPQNFTRPFTATATYSDASTADLTEQAAWTSSNTSISTISNATGTRGLATGVAAGMTTITATFMGVSGSTTLNVSNESLSSIVVAPSTVTLQVAETQQMTATGTFSGGTVLDITNQVNWKSFNKNVASVNNQTAKGLVTAKASGNATIQARKGNRQDTAMVTVQ